MSLKPRSVPSKLLAQNLASNGATLYLSNTLDWDDAQLSSADFGSQLFAVLRNPTNTQIEFVELDPATVTSAAAITILKRGLGYDGTQVAGTETAYDWNAFDTIVELGADTPQIIAQLVEEAGNETIAGIKTFSSVPATTGGNPVAANDLVRKAYVDSLLAGVASTISLIVNGTAGETIADGQLLYYKSADGRWWKADADAAGTSENVILGIAQGAGTAGNAIANGIMLQGIDDAQSGLVAGTIYYASGTAGAISASAGTKEVTVGMAKSATELYFNPRFNQQITEDEQDALVGTSGTPSATNKFVTDADTSGSGSLVRSSTRFGGTGADGALAISSGTTNIDCGSAAVVVKNYTSIAITGTGVLGFTNPHANGTVIILKSQGDVAITSSTNPCIDLRSVGGTGGAQSAATASDGNIGTLSLANTAKGGGGVYGGAVGPAGTQLPSLIMLNHQVTKQVYVYAGSGGGGGASSNTGGAGGRGGGGLYIECRGALNFTGTINASGAAGAAGVGTGGAGGGGGAAGLVVILYNTLTSAAGTITATGGAGGAAGSGGTDTSNRGGGGAASPNAAGGAGGSGAGAGSNAGGTGAGGGGGGSNSAAGGTAGATMGGLVAANTEFI